MAFNGWLCGVLRRELSGNGDTLRSVLHERRRTEAAKLGERNLPAAVSLLMFRRDGSPLVDCRRTSVLVSWLKRARAAREARSRANAQLAELDKLERKLASEAKQEVL